MKKILLSAMLLASGLIQAQQTCATAVVLPGPGTYAVTGVNGTYVGDCLGGNGALTPAAVYYQYTPTENVSVTISSDLAINPPSTDTRLTVTRGTCAELFCVDANDDINFEGNNYRSEVTFDAEAGVPYTIIWDNRWSAAGFSFSLTATPIACMAPSVFGIDVENVTTSGATISWQAVGGTSSTGYEVSLVAVGGTPESGAPYHTTDAATTEVTLSGLTSSDYQFYIRSVCGEDQSAWVGPIGLYLPTTLPYANNFDSADPLNGFTVGNFVLSTSVDQAMYAHTPQNFVFHTVTPAAPANGFFATRALSLSANEQVTVNFASSYLGAATSSATVTLTVGTTPVFADHTPVQTFTVPGGAVFALLNGTWTAPEAGVYYFGFHHNTATTTGNASLVIDTINITSVLSTNEVLSGAFGIYPNPASDIVSVKNSKNIQINGISLTDLNGRVVLKNTASVATDTQINVAELSAGIYLMTVETAQGSFTTKLIKK